VVIVLDNYSVHRAKPVKDALVALRRVGVELYFLPAYSPELNLIEAEWRQVKHQDSPVRSHLTGDDLQAAVDAVLTQRATRFHQPTHNIHEAAQ
jgi:putative transposase